MEGLWTHPYISLDSLLSLKSLPIIFEEIRQAYALGITTEWRGGGFFDSGDPQYKDLIPTGQAIEMMDSDEKKIFYALNPDVDPENCLLSYYHYLNKKQFDYLKYMKKVYFSWQNNFNIRPMKRWRTKHLPELPISQDAQDLLPKTISFIDALPFETWGRVTIFGNDPYCPVPTHKDTRIRWYEGEQYPEFIYLSLGNDPKGFYIYDQHAQQRYYVESRSAWFNENDYHGADPRAFCTWSLRVDGIYLPEFRQALVTGHQRTPSI